MPRTIVIINLWEDATIPRHVEHRWMIIFLSFATPRHNAVNNSTNETNNLFNILSNSLKEVVTVPPPNL